MGPHFPPPTLRSFLRSFSLPGWKKATLSFYCRRQRSARRRRRSRSAAAHQTKSAVVMLILLCLVTRHSDGDGRCRCRRRRREGGTAGRRGERRSWGAALPGRRAGRGSGPIDQGTLVLAGLTRCYIVFVHLLKTMAAIKKLAHDRARRPSIAPIESSPALMLCS